MVLNVSNLEAHAGPGKLGANTPETNAKGSSNERGKKGKAMLWGIPWV
jgi:hypothetical protein